MTNSILGMGIALGRTRSWGRDPRQLPAARGGSGFVANLTTGVLDPPLQGSIEETSNLLPYLSLDFSLNSTRNNTDDGIGMETEILQASIKH